jgi:hypothetical protein
MGGGEPDVVLSLVLGGATAWLDASRSVRTEMRAALLVGRQTVESAIERLQQARDPSRDLDELVASFEGNRHLRVRLVGEAQAIAAPVVESPPFGAVPNWFVRLVGVMPVTGPCPDHRQWAAITGQSRSRHRRELISATAGCCEPAWRVAGKFLEAEGARG